MQTADSREHSLSCRSSCKNKASPVQSSVAVAARTLRVRWKEGVGVRTRVSTCGGDTELYSFMDIRRAAAAALRFFSGITRKGPPAASGIPREVLTLRSPKPLFWPRVRGRAPWQAEVASLQSARDTSACAASRSSSGASSILTGMFRLRGRLTGLTPVVCSLRDVDKRKDGMYSPTAAPARGVNCSQNADSTLRES